MRSLKISPSGSGAEFLFISKMFFECTQGFWRHPGPWMFQIIPILTWTCCAPRQMGYYASGILHHPGWYWLVFLYQGETTAGIVETAPSLLPSSSSTPFVVQEDGHHGPLGAFFLGVHWASYASWNISPQSIINGDWFPAFDHFSKASLKSGQFLRRYPVRNNLLIVESQTPIHSWPCSPQMVTFLLKIFPPFMILFPSLYRTFAKSSSLICFI